LRYTDAAICTLLLGALVSHVSCAGSKPVLPASGGPTQEIEHAASTEPAPAPCDAPDLRVGGANGLVDLHCDERLPYCLGSIPVELFNCTPQEVSLRAWRLREPDGTILLRILSSEVKVAGQQTWSVELPGVWSPGDYELELTLDGWSLPEQRLTYSFRASDRDRPSPGDAAASANGSPATRSANEGDLWERCDEPELYVAGQTGTAEVDCGGIGTCRGAVPIVLENCTESALLVEGWQIWPADEGTYRGLEIVKFDPPSVVPPQTRWIETLVRSPGRYVFELGFSVEGAEATLTRTYTVPQVQTEELVAQCERKCGGPANWGYNGPVLGAGCVCRTPDAGQPCRSGDDCLGPCHMTNRRSFHCAPYLPHFGCDYVLPAGWGYGDDIPLVCNVWPQGSLND
jgi:hypothetical protein